MTSFLNKVANSVTSGTSSLIGRDKVTRLTNSLNKVVKSKYRDFMRAGNTVQIISRTSHMSLHICVSQNDTTRLILLGNGQIGPEALNSHFLIEKDKSSNHLKFRNGNNYIAFDNEVPCILSDPPNPRNPQEKIRARNEFRLVEIIGSDEYFCLESVYFPGRFLSVNQDGSITCTKNRSEEKAQFCLNIIHVMPQPGKNSKQATPEQAVVITTSQYVPAPPPGVGVSGRPVSYSTNDSGSEASLQIGGYQQPSGAASKAGEAAAAASSAQPTSNLFGSLPTSEPTSSSVADPPPPNYSNIFPSLPKANN